VDLTTSIRVKRLVDIDKPDWDELILDMISAVSAEVEGVIDRKTLIGAYTEHFDVPLNGSDQVFSLEAYPVTAVTTVHYDPDREFAAADLLDADEYALMKNGRTGRLLVFSELGAWPSALKVVYTGGMSTDTNDFVKDFPQIAYAVDLQVQFLFQRRRDLGVASISGNAGTVTHERIALMPIVREILEPHRRHAYR